MMIRKMEIWRGRRRDGEPTVPQTLSVLSLVDSSVVSTLVGLRARRPHQGEYGCMAVDGVALCTGGG